MCSVQYFPSTGLYLTQNDLECKKWVVLNRMELMIFLCHDLQMKVVRASLCILIKKNCKGKQTCIKTLNRFNIHSKTAGFNTTQHWVKYGQTQRLGWFWHRRLVKHLTQLLVEKSPITGFVHILPSIFLSVVNNIGCPLFTRPGWKGYLMRNKKLRQDWIVSIGNWLDCKRGSFFFFEWTCTDESCTIRLGTCIKKGQFHVDLILAAFMQILLWNDMGRN